jgi:uncharacterized protein (DUF169 family)
MIRKLLLVLVVATLVVSCTKADRASFARGIDAKEGRIERIITVRNSRTDSVIWTYTGTANMRNDSDGDYTFTLFEDGNIRRVFFNGRDLCVSMEDK